MSGLFALVARDVRRAWSQGTAILPIGFFLLVAVLFAFAIGPDGALLARVGPGAVWTAALLAALLPVDRMFAADRDTGVLDQLAVRGMTDAMVAAARMLGHWLSFAPPLLAATLPAAALLHVGGDRLVPLLAGLAIGTAGLAALGVATAAVLTGVRGAGALAGVVMLPFAVPVLIFGVGAAQGQPEAMRLLGAVSLLLVAGAPFVAGAALRIGRE